MLHNRVLRLESSKARREFPFSFFLLDFILSTHLHTFTPTHLHTYTLALRTFALSHFHTFPPSHLLIFISHIFFVGTANFGYLSDAPIKKAEVIDALKGRGSLETISIEHFVTPEGVNSTFGLVTFAYPDDYADALQVSRLSNVTLTLP
jgi:hypothetical protein